LLEGSSAWTIANEDEVKPFTSSGNTIASFQDWENRENKVKVLSKMFVKDSIIPHIQE